MPPNSSSGPVRVAVLSGEHRIRSALRALLETDSAYAVSVGATGNEARALLTATRPTAVIVGLGAGTTDDAEMLEAARKLAPDQTIVVGSRDGLDLDAGPDAILAAVAAAIGPAGKRAR